VKVQELKVYYGNQNTLLAFWENTTGNISKLDMQRVLNQCSCIRATYQFYVSLVE